MSRSLYVDWNLDAVDHTLDTIGAALASKLSLLNYRRELEERREELRELLEAIRYCNDEPEFEGAYLHLFDALAFITQAVKGREVSAANLAQCQDSLWKFRGKAVSS